MSPTAPGATSPIAAWDEPEDPPRAAVILAHGAGGDHRAKLLASVARGLAASGIAVARFDFGYRRAGRKLPDKMPVLVPEWAAALDAVRARWPGVPVVIGGKSMGGRAATHLAAEGADVRGIVLLGYPLHPAGKPDKLRDAHLGDVPVPLLFLQGTRDALCDLALLRPVLARLGSRAALHVVDDGDHGLEVRKTIAGRSTDEAWAEVLGVIRAFALRVCSRAAP